MASKTFVTILLIVTSASITTQLSAARPFHREHDVHLDCPEVAPDAMSKYSCAKWSAFCRNVSANGGMRRVAPAVSSSGEVGADVVTTALRVRTRSDTGLGTSGAEQFRYRVAMRERTRDRCVERRCGTGEQRLNGRCRFIGLLRLNRSGTRPAAQRRRVRRDLRLGESCTRAGEMDDR